ncbi:acetate kinase [Aneurinibacillus soli]|uniref:Acetate kinase n=1 Tax=Aneurinibacillus soli TaxID=1500254 RepID=A0A0U5B3Q1_9BACL|nr:acetate/propionate family kinase [Aneurinibacillus soli]PYE64050.1 acetate kinase [Aneurinibacillus soli]BAU27999.1 Acetate kinase [Aneurinibacillus soli]
MKVPVGISNRHVHLSREHLDILFGEGYQLTKTKDLKQTGQFAAEETVNIKGPKGKIHHVRILGPERKQTQVEISKTDGYVLGVNPPIRDSGDLVETPGVTIIGPKGEVTLQEGLILAARHIHMDETDAAKIGVKDKELVSVRVDGERSLILENVLCRVNKNFVLEFHVDTDEGNASGVKNGDFVEIIKIDSYHEVEIIEEKTILLFNCGSSSIKYKLYIMPNKQLLDSGVIENIKLEDYEHALSTIAQNVQKYPIDVIAHRVVHGGEEFAKSVRIDETVKATIKKLTPFAPLHNPVNLAGIEWSEKLFPGIPQVAIFDTAFHQTMPPASFIYPIPYEYYENYKIRKYGFHGSSHRYVMERAEVLMELPKEKLRLISCHIGNGVSLTAIRYGVSYDTTMGFTPISGVSMGTRSGNIDPGIIPYLAEIEQTDISGVVDGILNKQSGLLGLSGKSNDIRDVLQGVREGDERCKLAIDNFTKNIHSYIGQYLARLHGVDGIIFTAGIGENSAEIRDRICSGFEYAGVVIDQDANYHAKGERFISSRFSPIKVMVIPTNEELIMARDAYQLVTEMVSV